MREIARKLVPNFDVLWKVREKKIRAKISNFRADEVRENLSARNFLRNKVAKIVEYSRLEDISSLGRPWKNYTFRFLVYFMGRNVKGRNSTGDTFANAAGFARINFQANFDIFLYFLIIILRVTSRGRYRGYNFREGPQNSRNHESF